MGYLVGYLGATVLAVSSPILLPNPSICRGRKRKLWGSENTPQQQAEHWGVINTVLPTNAKHGIIWAARKKINSVSSTLSTNLLEYEDIEIMIKRKHSKYQTVLKIFSYIFLILSVEMIYFLI